jgi:hypothetical protein
LVTVLIHINFGGITDKPSPQIAENDALMLARMPDDASGNYGVPMPPLGVAHEQTVNRIVKPGGAIYLPAILPGRSVDRCIRHIRRRIDSRRDALLEMIDRDLGEGLRQDVWDISAPLVSRTA